MLVSKFPLAICAAAFLNFMSDCVKTLENMITIIMEEDKIAVATIIKLVHNCTTSLNAISEGTAMIKIQPFPL